MSIPLGSLCLAFVHQLTGGRWGKVAQPIWLATIRTLPLFLIAFVPIVFMLPQIYPWASGHEHLPPSKALYLSPNFFIVRSAFYFLSWYSLGYLYRRRWDPTVMPLKHVAGFGLLLMGLTITFASIDWIMSLNPEWFSAIFGLIASSAFVVTAFSFTIFVAIRATTVPTQPLHDLGKLMFAFLMLWAYLSFSQFLIIWSGNLPEEIPWYIRRTHGGWREVAGVLILAGFFSPFFLLLSRTAKQKPRLMLWIVGAVFLIRPIEAVWLIAPEFHESIRDLSFIDPLVFLAMGAVWLLFFKQAFSHHRSHLERVCHELT
jgi:hypothetical protein